MSQSTVSPTSPVFLGDAPQAVQPVTPVTPEPDAADTVAAIPVFDAERAHALYVHKILGRILASHTLPLPSTWWAFTWCTNTMNLEVANASAVQAYATIFGGTVEQERRESSLEGRTAQLRSELTTVIDGLDITVWSTEDAPAEVEAAAETVEVAK